MRQLRDPQRGLAERGLRIDAALAGDHEVGAVELLAEPGLLHDDLDTGNQPDGREPVGDGQQPERRPAGRAGAGRLALVAARSRRSTASA